MNRRWNWKEPFCIWLSNYLEKLQFKVGIVASGYKSNGSSPKVVDKSSSPLNVGDEAIELASMTNAIVVSSTIEQNHLYF